MNRPAMTRRQASRHSQKGPLVVLLVGFLLLAGAAWLGLRVHGRPSAGSDRTASSPDANREGESVASNAASAATGPGRLIDGVRLAADAQTEESPYLAVIIDNHAEARPASGLSRASVVYEAPAEAGITRFLAIFASQAGAEKIGPVRSARPYFIDWADEYGALLAHCGGSPEALARLKTGRDAATDFNEFWNGASFWRSTDRSAPHNVYSSSALLEKAAVRRGAEARQLQAWRFKDDAPLAERPQEASFHVGSRTKGYDVTWRYRRDENAYERLQGGQVQRDDGQAVLAHNVVVQFTQIGVIDSAQRRRITTVGEGKAAFAIDGQTYRGTWRKDSLNGRTRFFDASGNELRLNRGMTWIEVVPDNTEVQ